MRELTTTATAEDIWSPEGERLPQTIYLGTSTWAFPGWKGLVYRRTYKSHKEFTAPNARRGGSWRIDGRFLHCETTYATWDKLSER